MVQEPDEEMENGPKLRIRVYYNWSDVQRYNDLLMEWQNTLNNDIAEYRDIEEALEHLTSPFSFFVKQVMKGGIRLDTEDVEDLQKQDFGDTDFHQHEKEIE